MLNPTETLEELGGDSRGGLRGMMINLVLGGIVLWVGQATFEHAGELTGARHQIKAINDRYEQIVGDLNKRTQSRFTREDGDQVGRRIGQLQETLDTLKDTLQEKISRLNSRLAAVETELHMQQDPRYMPTGRQPERTASYTGERLISEMFEVRRQIDRIDQIVGQNHGRIERMLQGGHAPLQVGHWPPNRATANR